MGAMPEDKQIAKEILLKLMDTNGIIMDDYPNSKNYPDAVCKAYK